MVTSLAKGRRVLFGVPLCGRPSALIEDEIERARLVNEVEKFRQESRTEMVKAAQKNLDIHDELVKKKQQELESSKKRRSELEQLLR